MNKIGWCDETWNPVTGCYGPGGSQENIKRCPYCYAHRLAKRLRGRYGYPVDDPFRPTLHLDRLKTPYGWKKPRKIFVCSMGDIFGDDNCLIWARKIEKVIEENPHHTFQLLTKNPIGYCWLNKLSSNIWCGVTVDGSEGSVIKILILRIIVPGIKFVSFEPLLAMVNPDLRGINWIIIGADSTRGAKRPPQKWADVLIEQARDLKIPVFVKDNYGYPEIIKEFPYE